MCRSGPAERRGSRTGQAAGAGRPRAARIPADRALLDIWTGPFPTGPELIDQMAGGIGGLSRTGPRPGTDSAMPTTTQGLSAGVADPFRLAAEAFQRGLGHRLG